MTTPCVGWNAQFGCGKPATHHIPMYFARGVRRDRSLYLCAGCAVEWEALHFMGPKVQPLKGGRVRP